MIATIKLSSKELMEAIAEWLNDRLAMNADINSSRILTIKNVEGEDVLDSGIEVAVDLPTE